MTLSSGVGYDCTVCTVCWLGAGAHLRWFSMQRTTPGASVVESHRSFRQHSRHTSFICISCSVPLSIFVFLSISLYLVLSQSSYLSLSVSAYFSISLCLFLPPSLHPPSFSWSLPSLSLPCLPLYPPLSFFPYIHICVVMFFHLAEHEEAHTLQ